MRHRRHPATARADPVRDAERLRDWQLFNYLIGNYDGHAKNLSSLYDPDSAIPSASPTYAVSVPSCWAARAIGSRPMEVAMVVAEWSCGVFEPVD